jgi:hypothetical protein
MAVGEAFEPLATVLSVGITIKQCKKKYFYPQFLLSLEVTIVFMILF